MDSKIKYQAVFPEQQEIIRKDEKTYVKNLKVMLGQNLYKEGKIIKLTDNLSKSLKINDPPINWWISEKWDGIRAIWDGEKFISRGSASGNPKVYSFVPEYFKELMPPGIALDGEIWIGRGQFSDTSRLSTLKIGSTYKTENSLEQLWIDNNVKYKVFDLPNSSELFESRYKYLQSLIKFRQSLWNNIKQKYNIPNIDCPIQLTEQNKIDSMDKLINIYKELTSQGAEGVMLRAPNSPYELKRSKYLLKFKIRGDAEAIVKEYILGTGRLKDLLGSLKCELLLDNKGTNIIFNIGSGFSDEQRTEYKNPDSKFYIPINSLVSFHYMELSKDSVPRHPVFKGLREDISIPKLKMNEKIDHKKNIIETFKVLMNSVETNKEANWQYKKKHYKQVSDVISNYKEDINSTEQVLEILRESGLKFTNEEQYYKKNGEYKSSIIIKINTVIKLGLQEEPDKKNIIISNICKIPGIGNSKANELYSKGIDSIETLLNEYKKNKDIINSKQAIGLLNYNDLILRIPRTEMDEWNKIFIKNLKNVLNNNGFNSDSVQYQMVGSYRRKCIDSGDIDILLTSNLDKSENSNILKQLINLLFESKQVKKEDVLSFGNTKFMGLGLLNKYKRHIDIFFYNEQEYPFVLLFSTGSAGFNVEMRAYCLKNGYSLNEKKLLKIENKKLIDISEEEYMKKINKKFPLTEEDIFKFLNLEYIKPENRENGKIKIIL